MFGIKDKLLSGVGTLAFTAVAGSGAAVITSAEASAQWLWDRDRNVSVSQRPRPEYDALGLRAGAFIWKPELYLGVQLDDNIFATATNEESDTIFVVNPSITVDTTWSNHAFSAFADVTRNEYSDFGSESTTDYSLGASGRLDIARGSSINASAAHNRGTEPRTSAGAAGFAAEPIRFDTTSFAIGAEHTFNRLRLRGGYDFVKADYDSALLIGGGVASQDFRDQDTHRFTLRGDFAISPDTAVFARYRFNQRDFDLAPPAVANNRDSDGYTLDVGVEFDLGGVARGEIGAGYTKQEYDSPVFGTIDGVSVDGLLEWFPTQLTTLTFTARRGIEDSGIAASAGYIGTALSAQADHELMRNVIITGRLDYANDDYQGIDREDERWGASVQATYLLNRNVGFSASYSRLDQSSSGIAAPRDFTTNRFMVGVLLQY
ncbi:MAG: Outer membrane protein/protective antigen OMA87 [Oceanicaulis sp. HLUCCA04]|nr:MAG: Outer membrane protein/protective antigen OMA87 [Oceanicaulis sp. HLUCCA04]